MLHSVANPFSKIPEATADQCGCFVNPRHTCAARVTVVIPVCLSVTTLAKASLGSTPRKRYVQHWYRLFSVLSSWIFEKTFRSKVIA